MSAARSPFGPEDEIGMLNLATQAGILTEVDPGRVFDLTFAA